MTVDLATPRLLLRPMVRADVPLLAGLNSDPLVMRFVTGRASTTSAGAPGVRRGGRGLAAEAAGAVLDWLFLAGAERLVAQTMAVNDRSRALMDRLGMRLDRSFVLDWDDPLPGAALGEVEYVLTCDEWRQIRSTGLPVTASSSSTDGTAE